MTQTIVDDDDTIAVLTGLTTFYAAQVPQSEGQHGDLGLVVDYLEFMSARKKGEERPGRSLRAHATAEALALDLEMRVVALSQLNRSLEHRATDDPHAGRS